MSITTIKWREVREAVMAITRRPCNYEALDRYVQKAGGPKAVEVAEQLRALAQIAVRVATYIECMAWAIDRTNAITFAESAGHLIESVTTLPPRHTPTASVTKPRDT